MRGFDGNALAGSIAIANTQKDLEAFQRRCGHRDVDPDCDECWKEQALRLQLGMLIELQGIKE